MKKLFPLMALNARALRAIGAMALPKQATLNYQSARPPAYDRAIAAEEDETGDSACP
jgi:hypothetical protein